MIPLLSDRHEAVRRAVRAFCDRELVPIARALDDESRFPWEVVEKMGRLGFFGVTAPRSLGGSGLDAVSYVLTIMEISRACAALGLCVSVHNSVALHPILTFGTEEQKQRFAPPLARGEKIGAFCLTEPNAGSDASAIEATALRDGDHFVVNANKVYVTNGGVADTCIVFCRTDPAAGRKGISAVIVERGTPGFSVGELEDMCGLRANPVSTIRLSDCRVPVANLLGKLGAGLRIGLDALDTGRIGIAAQAVGICDAALDAAVRYAKQRRQFGVPIEKHQGVSNMIADMATRTDAARLMVLRAAELKDAGQDFGQAAAMAKLYASEAATFVTDLAVQVHGGYGYSKSYHVERYYRDARVTRIYEGTSEVHRMVIARGVIGS